MKTIIAKTGVRVLTLIIVTSFLYKSKVLAQQNTPIQVAPCSHIYHYTLQKNLDTLGYGFKLGKKTLQVGGHNIEGQIWPQKEIEKFENKLEAINSLDDFGPDDNLYFSFYLKEYSEQGNVTERMEHILRLSNKLDYKADKQFISTTGFCALDHALLNNTDTPAKEMAREILITRLALSLPINMRLFATSLIEDFSEEYYQALLQLKSNFDTLTTKFDKESNTFSYYRYVLPEIARVGGKRAVPIIFEDMQTSINEYPRFGQSIKEGVENALRILIQYHEFDPVTDKALTTEMKKHGIERNKLQSNNALAFNRFDEIEKKALETGIISTNVTNLQRFDIAAIYCLNGYTLDIHDVLEELNVVFSYSTNPHRGSGHIVMGAGPYKRLMEMFLLAAKHELSGFQYETYLRDGDDGFPDYALCLKNEKEAFVVKLTDRKTMDYDHEAVSYLFNAVLKSQKKEKKFSGCLYDQNKKMQIWYEKSGAIDSFFNAIGYLPNESDIKCRRGESE